MTVPSPDRSGETPFSELEKGFFASAPPDVAQPAPEPVRFDDLVAIEAPRPQDVASFRREIPTGMRRAVDAASVTRANLKRVLAGARQRVRPALASVKGPAATIASAAARGSKVALAATARGSRVALGAATRGSKVAIAAARRASLRTVRASGRLGAVLATRRTLTVAIAIAVFATGITVGVASSRGGAGPNVRASAPLVPAPAIAAPANVEPPAPIAPANSTVVAEAAPAEAEPAPVAIAPAPPALEPRPSSPAEQRPSRAAAPKRAPHPHRRHATFSARNDLIVPTFMAPSPRQEAGNRPAPAPSNRPIFSR